MVRLWHGYGQEVDIQDADQEVEEAVLVEAEQGIIYQGEAMVEVPCFARGRVQQPVEEPPSPPPVTPTSAQTKQDQVLSYGLELAGFPDSQRYRNISLDLKARRYGAFYGIGSLSTARLHDTLREETNGVEIKWYSLQY